jgi:hypothetical protein
VLINEIAVQTNYEIQISAHLPDFGSPRCSKALDFRGRWTVRSEKKRGILLHHLTDSSTMRTQSRVDGVGERLVGNICQATEE